MNIEQYMLDNRLNQTQLAELCGVTQRAISNAIKQEYIIINSTIYSPRFKIKESLKSGEKENE